MKKDRTKRKVSILLYIVAIVMPFLPLFSIGGKSYALYQGYMHVKESGIGGVSENAAQIWSGDISLIRAQIVIVMLYQIVSICYILSVLARKNLRLNIAAMVLALVNLFLAQDGMETVADNVMGMLFSLVLGLFSAIEFLVIKMMDVWESSVRMADENARKDRRKKEEEKRRLYFPGNYTKVFYGMVWKNFKYNWRDYRLLLMCSVMMSSLTFAGLGCYQMMAGMHRAENFLIGQGLGLILWNAMIPMGVCVVFLMVFVLVFYLKKWVEGYSIFVTLGIRKKTLYIMMGLEIMFCFLFSFLAGILLGNGLLLLLRKVIYEALGQGIVLMKVTAGTYFKMLGVMLVIYVISLMATRDIIQDFNLITAATRRIRREKMPRRRLKIAAAVGVLLLFGSAALYSRLSRHESIYLLGAFFVGLFLILRYGGAMCLKRENRRAAYFVNLMNHNHLYHKSKTTSWYLTALSVLYVCGMFYFAFQAVSVISAEEPESLYPYDFVCITDEGDDAFLSGLEDKYGVKSARYPMVRVSNVDKTERSEGRQAKPPQGQQIGISESTFHQLKKELDGSYRKKALGLDKEGERVYIVHQQDRSVKAQPVDWTYNSGKPFLHIGLPCVYYTSESPSKAFTSREVAGEEIGSLIGCFRQGNLENMIVFSDDYFEKAKEMWRYTNIYTGDPIEDEAGRIEDVTIHQGPTQLVLIHAEAEYVDEIEREMGQLETNHAYEAKYDAEVKSHYSKKTAISDMETEHMMKLIVNGFLIAVLLIASLFLLYVKTASELEEKKRRAEFLNCMGMRRKERIRMLKGELYLFYWLPALITAFAVLVFTAATFHARMYTGAVIKDYLSYAVWIWSGWLLIEGIYVWLLGLWEVRKVEEKDDRGVKAEKTSR